jgi:hypothetical protein
MNKANKSIRACLEEQAKTEHKKNVLKKSQLRKKQLIEKADSLGLNWKDVVVFSLMMVLGCGYWLQAGLFMVV